MGSPDQKDDLFAPLIAGINRSFLEGLWRWLDRCAGPWLEALGLSGSGIGPLQLPVLEEAVRSIEEDGATLFRRITWPRLIPASLRNFPWVTRMLL